MPPIKYGTFRIDVYSAHNEPITLGFFHTIDNIHTMYGEQYEVSSLYTFCVMNFQSGRIIL